MLAALNRKFHLLRSLTADAPIGSNLQKNVHVSQLLNF